MKASLFSEALKLDSKISSELEQTSKNLKPVRNCFGADQVYEMVCSGFEKRSSVTEKAVLCSPKQDHSIVTNKNGFNKPGGQRDWNKVLIQNEKLAEELLTLKRNHQEEIEFYLQQEMSLLVNVEKLLLSKQYRRLSLFLEKQISSLSERLIHHSQTAHAHPHNNSVASQLTITERAEDIFGIDPLVDNLHSNIEEFQLETLTILPVIKKLMSERQLSVQRLSRYFSKPPFDLSKQLCDSLASRLVNQMGYKSGSQVVELIVERMKSKTQMLKDSRHELSISQIIQRHSLHL